MPATGAYKLRPATKPVTVRHLFTHTSGLGYRFTSPTLRDYKPRAGDPARPLLFEPGEQWMYGTSTDWLGRLVEKISGLALDEYFRRRIFAPLQMSDTFYDVPQAKQARLVAAHRRQVDGSLAKLPVQPRPKGFKPIGGGGLSSTASDYIRFTRMLLNGGELDGARILSAGSVDAMAQNQIGSRRGCRRCGPRRQLSATTSRSSPMAATNGASVSSSRPMPSQASGPPAA